MRALLLLPLALAACATNGAVGTATGPWRDQLRLVPEHPASGPALTLTLRTCRPPGDAPARVVVINHATPQTDVGRQALQPAACTSPAAQWFLARGYAVALPLRRGYGARPAGDASPLPESPGPCALPNFVQAGLAGAADIAATVDYVATLPFVQHEGAVVLGEGSGGWATTAYGSLPHPAVTALIALDAAPSGPACRADLLAYSAAYYATTARTPMLWIYAAGNPAVSPATASAMASAYQTAGAPLQLEHAPAPTPLLTDPTRWGSLVAAYLATN